MTEKEYIRLKDMLISSNVEDINLAIEIIRKKAVKFPGTCLMAFKRSGNLGALISKSLGLSDTLKSLPTIGQCLEHGKMTWGNIRALSEDHELDLFKSEFAKELRDSLASMCDYEFMLDYVIIIKDVK